MKKRRFCRLLPYLLAVLMAAIPGVGCALLESDSSAALGFEKALVTRVVDGDTAYALFQDGSEEKVRFIGVDTPEINHPRHGEEPFGAEAAEYARRQLEGKTIWLEYDTGERDQYGRLLAYIWLDLPDEITDPEIREKMFNARLLLEGYAVWVVFQPNVRYAGSFELYEAEARAAAAGLWGLPVR